MLFVEFSAKSGPFGIGAPGVPAKVSVTNTTDIALCQAAVSAQGALKMCARELLSAVNMRRKNRDIAQVAVVLGVVEAIPNDKLDRDIKTDVGNVNVDLECFGLAEHCANFDRSRTTALQVFLEPRERQTRIDDVLNNQHVTVSNVGVQVFEDLHNTTRFCSSTVRRDGHPVHLCVEPEFPRQVSHHHNGTFENTNQQWWLVLIVSLNLACEFREPVEQFRLRVKHFGKVVAQMFRIHEAILARSGLGTCSGAELRSQTTDLVTFERLIHKIIDYEKSVTRTWQSDAIAVKMKGMITLNEPQIWTLIGVFAAALLGLTTVITQSFTRTMSANMETMSANFRGIETRLDSMAVQVDAKFDTMNERIDGLKTEMTLRFERVDERFERVDERFEQVDKRFEQVESRIDGVGNRLTTIEKQVAGIDGDVQLLMKQAFPK